ncbi:MAG: hypothetical protein JNL72_08830 [Flavipsychrobacter sp.]|nr:hypothetical protein [Flavipsychrobacter sp.]
MRNLFLTLGLTLALIAPSFAQKSVVSDCYLSFNDATGLTKDKTDRLPEGFERQRAVPTAAGDVMVSRSDGYRVLYNNPKNVPFVNLKIERSEDGQYEEDQKKLMDNIRYFSQLEGHTFQKLEFNGYAIYGSSRTSIEKGSFLGTFVMFPGDGVAVYFYLQNLRAGYRHFETTEEYERLRDTFIEEYTRHLKKCMGK